MGHVISHNRIHNAWRSDIDICHEVGEEELGEMGDSDKNINWKELIIALCLFVGVFLIWKYSWHYVDTSITDATDLGLSGVEHPLLGAATKLAGSDGMLLSGWLARSEHPWLSDHAVFDAVLMPGTGLLELVLAAARAVGCDTVRVGNSTGGSLDMCFVCVGHEISS